MKTVLKHQAASATWWSAIEIASRYGIQFIVLILLARLLTPTDFGLITMLLVFTSVAALLVNVGFGTALVQKQQTSADDEITVFFSGLGIGIVAALVLWLAAPAIATFYAQPLLAPLTRLLLFVLPLAALAVVPDALLTQRLDFRSRANAEILASTCSGVAAVVLAWLGFGVWSLAWQAIIAIALRATVLWWLSGWRPSGSISMASFRSLFGFGGYLLAANLLDMITIRLQSLLIGKLFDANALGYYTLAQNTQLAPAQFISGVLNRVGLPVFSKLSDQSERLLGALRLSLRVAMFVFVPCMVGLAVVARPLIRVVFGTEWETAAPLLSVLSLAAAFWPLHVLNLAAIGARGRSDLIFKLQIAKSAVSIVLIAFCSIVSVIAIAWAVLASSMIAVCINTWYSRRLLAYGMLDQVHDQIATLLLSATAAGVAWLVSHWLSHVWLALAAAVVAAAATYFGLAALFRVAAWRELMAVLQVRRSHNPISIAPID